MEGRPKRALPGGSDVEHITMEINGMNERSERMSDLSDLLARTPIHRFKRTYCKDCGSDITDAPRFQGLCSCQKCNAWTANVEVKDAGATIFIPAC